MVNAISTDDKYSASLFRTTHRSMKNWFESILLEWEKPMATSTLCAKKIFTIHSRNQCRQSPLPSLSLTSSFQFSQVVKTASLHYPSFGLSFVGDSTVILYLTTLDGNLLKELSKLKVKAPMDGQVIEPSIDLELQSTH